ncbi:hypothetical protein [Mycolicibacterium sp. XJ1819]
MMSARMRAVVVSATVVSVVLAGCSQSAPPVPTTTPTPSGSGIVVVAVEDPASPVVGFIDPSSGKYSHAATLNVSPESFSVANPGDIRLAPDWSRYAVTREVDGAKRAGWVDPESNFTDVDGGEAIGFDGLGNFFYRGSGGVHLVRAGQSDGGEPVPYLPDGDDVVFKRDGAGRLFDAVWCPTFAASWLSPAEYLHVSGDGRQILKTDIGDTPGLRNCDSAVGIPLLPTGNSTTVANPVASPDATRVAYVDDGGELWLVGTREGDTPAPLPVSGIDLVPAGRTMLVGWTSRVVGYNRPQDFSHRPDMKGTWSGSYFSAGLTGTGAAALHVDVSDPLTGSIVTRSGDLTCNSAVNETNRTPETLTVETTLKPGADPRCRGANTMELAWLDDQLSGVITGSSEAGFVGGTLIVRRR